MTLTTKQRKAIKGLVLIVAMLIVALIDLQLYMSPPKNDTISFYAWRWGSEHPGLILMIGILLGHFWPVRRG